MQSGAPDKSVRYGYLSASDDWQDAINPRRYDGVLGFVLRRFPLAIINIALFISLVSCAMGLAMLASRVIFDV